MQNKNKSVKIPKKVFENYSHLQEYVVIYK